MNDTHVPPAALRAGRRPVARLYSSIALGLVGRAFAVAQRVDPDVAREISELPAGFSFALKVHPGGPETTLRMRPDGRLSRAVGGHTDVLMLFANMDAALAVLTFSASAFQVYAKGGLAVAGDLGATMAIIRALGVIETLLLPGFIAKRVLKRVHRMPSGRKLVERLALYLSLPFAPMTKES